MPEPMQEQVNEVVNRMLQVDQLNQHMLLTVQAIQALHKALDEKFIPGPVHD